MVLLTLGHPATSTIIVVVDGEAEVVVDVGTVVFPELLEPLFGSS